MLFGNEDILASLDFFGDLGTIFLDTDSQIDVIGIFDYPTIVFDFDEKIVNQNPRFICRELDILDVKNGMKILINSINYTIRYMLPDGTGLTVLELKK
jgi:hypothetical protein